VWPLCFTGKGRGDSSVQKKGFGLVRARKRKTRLFLRRSMHPRVLHAQVVCTDVCLADVYEWAQVCVPTQLRDAFARTCTLGLHTHMCALVHGNRHQHTCISQTVAHICTPHVFALTHAPPPRVPTQVLESAHPHAHQHHKYRSVAGFTSLLKGNL
jgi:hypothetical protein